MDPAFRANVILLDIEGTVAPLSFVRDVLFPYAADHVQEFLAARFRTPEIQILFYAFEAHHGVDRKRGNEPPPLNFSANSTIVDSMAAYLRWLIGRDDKLLALKQLQGKIWQEGYERGELVAPVFPDVAPALARWTSAGRHVGVFSSGSVFAQTLFFSHTSAGDLSQFVSCFYDGTVGAKSDPRSYGQIIRAFEEAPERALFISDTAAELEAARRAGMQSAYIVRAGNVVQPVSDYTNPSILTFEEIP